MAVLRNSRGEARSPAAEPDDQESSGNGTRCALLKGDNWSRAGVGNGLAPFRVGSDDGKANRKLPTPVSGNLDARRQGKIGLHATVAGEYVVVIVARVKITHADSI